MVVPADSRSRPVFREPEIVGGRSLSTSASVAHCMKHRPAKKRLRSNIKNSIRLPLFGCLRFSTPGNFSANFIHLRYGIAFAVLEIQSHRVDTGRRQVFEKTQDHIAPGAQTQVNRARVNGGGTGVSVFCWAIDSVPCCLRPTSILRPSR